MSALHSDSRFWTSFPRPYQAFQLRKSGQAPRISYRDRVVPCTQLPQAFPAYSPNRFKDLGKIERNLIDATSFKRSPSLNMLYSSTVTTFLGISLSIFFPLSCVGSRWEKGRPFLCHIKSLPMPLKGNLVNEIKLFLLVRDMQAHMFP